MSVQASDDCNTTFHQFGIEQFLCCNIQRTCGFVKHLKLKLQHCHAQKLMMVGKRRETLGCPSPRKILQTKLQTSHLHSFNSVLFMYPILSNPFLLKALQLSIDIVTFSTIRAPFAEQLHSVVRSRAAAQRQDAVAHPRTTSEASPGKQNVSSTLPQS